MGITIHFEGKLKDEAAFEKVISVAVSFANKEYWQSEIIDERNAQLSRFCDDKDWDYGGPTRGIAMYPHAQCEPFRLEFDRDLFVQEYVKTQFAPATVHINIILLLKEIASEFVSLKVFDEAEYWETGNKDTLDYHLSSISRRIEESLASEPYLQAGVRLTSGRIVDLIS